MATSDRGLADELERFAAREAARGAWSHAAASLVAASRVSGTAERARTLLLRAVDSMLYHGHVAQAAVYAEELATFPQSPLRDCVLGFLAMLTSRREMAERLLTQAWHGCDRTSDRALASTIARRTALHYQYRLRGEETMAWSRRAIDLTAAERRGDVQAEMLPLGVGAAYAGRAADGIAAVEAALHIGGAGADGVTLRRARGWLRFVCDDYDGACLDLGQEAEAALRIGSLGVAAFALIHLARVEYVRGNWDASIVHAERAVVITAELEHPFLTFARLAATMVSAGRGHWAAAEAHVSAVGQRGRGEDDYEQTVVAAGIAQAHLAAARSDHAAVLWALLPVCEVQPREGVDEPGCWPWQHLYAEALVATDQLREAADFLSHHEALARNRQRVSATVRLARARGRLAAAAGDADAADGHFDWAIDHAQQVGMPFDLALTRLAWGQALRRRGRRRAAAAVLESARAQFAHLGAAPYRERCETEITACGLVPAKRREFDRDRLTPQELSVARLVASGLSNRQAAAELVVSVRTVEFHLTRIYAKLGVTSRAQLAILATTSPVIHP